MNLTAYDLFLRASWHPLKSFAQSEESLRLLDKATGLDPGYGAAFGLASFCIRSQKVFGWITPTDPKIAEGIRLAHLAYETGRDDSEALSMLASSIVFLDGDLDLATASAEKAISLNYNSPNAWWASGLTQMLRGDFQTALDHAGRARRLNPFDALTHDYWMVTAFTHFFAGNFEEAARAADRSLAEKGTFAPALRMKIAVAGILERRDDAPDYLETAIRHKSRNNDNWLARIL
jgi:tetratricopeptide (TPR) repeat protein